MASRSEKLVAFDLGGVLVRVAYEWRDAVVHAAINSTNTDALDTALGACPEFERFQKGLVELPVYLSALRDYLGLESTDAALKVHESILLAPFAGSEELVAELHQAGIATACLSNTNAPHWEVMRQHDHFPAIASLQMPVLSHVVNAEKPHTEIYEAFEQITGYSGSNVIFFDDVKVNILGALDMGWNAFQIDPNDDPTRQVREKLASLNII